MMLVERRREQVLELVRAKGFASLPDLTSRLKVSESTVRRDLDFLEDSGSVKRTHGGVFYTGASPKLSHFDQRQATQWEKKKEIARQASALIEDGDTILLDGGSTTYELARLLVGRSLQIVTNSLPVANLFASDVHTDLILVGGYVDHRTGVAIGAHAKGALAELNVRRAVLSVASIGKTHFYNSNLLIVETERAMMQSADEVIVLADSTKFGHQSLVPLCELGEVDRVVTDHEIAEPWQEEIKTAGVELIVAEAGEPRNE